MRGILIGGSLAIAGNLLGFVLATTSGIAVEANLWEVLTAIGTVGATGCALYFGLAGRRKETNDRVERLTSVLWLVDEAVQTAMWVADHLKARKEARDPTAIPLQMAELSAFLVSMDAINRIPFHEAHYAEGHRALIHVLGALRSLAPLIAECLVDGDDGPMRDKVWAGATVADQELVLAKKEDPCASLRAAGVLYVRM